MDTGPERGIAVPFWALALLLILAGTGVGGGAALVIATDRLDASGSMSPSVADGPPLSAPVPRPALGSWRAGAGGEDIPGDARRTPALNAIRLVTEVAGMDLPYVGAPPKTAERLVVLFASVGDPDGRAAIDGYRSRVLADRRLSVVLFPVGNSEDIQALLMAWHAARDRFPAVLDGLLAAAAERPAAILARDAGIDAVTLEARAPAVEAIAASLRPIERAVADHADGGVIQLIHARGGHVQGPTGVLDDATFEDRLERAAWPVERALAGER